MGDFRDGTVCHELVHNFSHTHRRLDESIISMMIYQSSLDEFSILVTDMPFFVYGFLIHGAPLMLLLLSGVHRRISK